MNKYVIFTAIKRVPQVWRGAGRAKLYLVACRRSPQSWLELGIQVSPPQHDQGRHIVSSETKSTSICDSDTEQKKINMGQVT